MFLSILWPILKIALVVAAIVAIIVLIVVLIRVANTMKSVDKLAKNADKELTPALKKVDPMMDTMGLTLDTVNLELLRVDGILEDVSTMSTAAGGAVSAVQSVTNAPAELVSMVVDKARGVLSYSKGSKGAAKQMYPAGKDTK